MPQPAWDGRSRGSTLGYRIFIGLLRRHGLRPAYGLLHLVALYYRLFVPAATRPLRYLYEKRLGYSPLKSALLIKKNILFFGQTLIDKIAVLAGGSDALTFEHEGIQHLEEMVKLGEGGLIISAHLGNWEVAGHLLERLEAPINVLMYDGEAEELKQQMSRFDAKRSFNIIYIREDLSHIYEISAALRRNEFICLHADRFRPGNRTMKHLFLGEQAHFPAGPFILASKLRARTAFVFAFKETSYHYHFIAWPSKTYGGHGTTGAEAMLDDYVALLEEQVKLHPDQWFNYFDFWKATA
jgi:predicted LPLAT superfamily acyltransferase